MEIGNYKPLKWWLVIVLFSAVLLFYWWSELIIISIIFFLLIDAHTLKVLPSLLRKFLPPNIVLILKYGIYTLLPLAVLIFVRTFFFDFYYVPSSSMEKTLSPDDYVLVNKVIYGTKVPININDIPVVGSFFDLQSTADDNNLFRSLKGVKSFNNNDIVVFKSVRNRNEYLIKRIVGLPGDTLSIEDSIVEIDNHPLLEMDSFCHDYIELDTIKRLITYSNREFKNLDFSEKEKLKRKAEGPKTEGLFLFPEDISTEKKWNPDSYGPIIVPKKGMTISLNTYNIKTYSDVITKYEGRKVDVVNHSEKNKHTFKNDYYFMMGDNRDNSIDSRVFGFVPESYIQGKMIMVLPK